MAETTQMNLNVQITTKERVKRMAQDTFRGPGDLIDFLVDEAWKRMYPGESVSVETVEASITSQS